MHQLERAINMHRAGDIAGATAVYDAVLQQMPDHPDALNLKARSALQQNERAGD